MAAVRVVIKEAFFIIVKLLRHDLSTVGQRVQNPHRVAFSALPVKPFMTFSNS
jgi:hypothetical protein